MGHRLNFRLQNNRLVKSILDRFYKWEHEKSEEIFLIQPTDSGHRYYSWNEVGCLARKMAGCFQSSGFEPGDRIALLSQNCAEWIIADLAIMMGGFISVPMYANVNADTLHDILVHCEAKLLLVGKLPDKDWLLIKDAIPGNVFTATLPSYRKTELASYDDNLNENHQFRDVILSYDDILTIIYTSGTTGKPKGIVHTQRSINNAIASAFETVLLHHKGNRFFSYLPLSHAAERGLVEFGAICSGGSISFVHSAETFAEDIQHAAPTHFFAVPRIWEKIQSKILQNISQRKLDTYLKIPVLNYIVKRKIKKTLGLHNAKVLISGAAPISQSLMTWFYKLGFEIQEAYGMSENFNVCALNPQNGAIIGTVGKLFPNQNLKIDPDTKEIIQRCDWIMKEYYKDPDLTAQTIRDGFLHTGDTGELSEDGFLTITGRIKDIFKTSKGEYIVPGKTEMNFNSLREVEQACVVGNQYPQSFMVVVLSETGKSMPEIELNKLLLNKLNECNEELVDYQKLKKIIIVNEEWTVENKLLTPTLKMKRNSISEKYEPVLKSLYWNENVISREPTFTLA